MTQRSGQWGPPPPGVHGTQPVRRPGAVSVAAAFAFAQAGCTAVTTVVSWLLTIMFPYTIVGFGEHDLGLMALLGLAQIAGVALLAVGGGLALAGRARAVLICACVLELVVCAFYLSRYALMSQLPSRTFLIWCAVVHAAMPAVSLFLVTRREATRYFRRPAAKARPRSHARPGSGGPPATPW